MQTTQPGFPWLAVIAIAGSLLGGGMMGSIITLLVTNYRNRRQPIGYSIETIDVFKQNPEFPSMRAFLDVGEDPETGVDHAHAVLANFSIVRVKVVNKGNQDIAVFKMGITLEEDTDAFDIKVETLDRHHVGEILTPINIADTKNELDFSLQPFNRTDLYTMSVYVMYKERVGPIKLSSAHSTRFVEIGSFKENRWNELTFYPILTVTTLFFSVFAFLALTGRLTERWGNIIVITFISLLSSIAFIRFMLIPPRQ